MQCTLVTFLLPLLNYSQLMEGISLDSNETESRIDAQLPNHISGWASFLSLYVGAKYDSKVAWHGT